MAEVRRSKTTRPIQGTLSVPGDKSISHRAIMFGSLAKGTTKITNFLHGEDCLRTVDAFRALGVTINDEGNNRVTIQSGGFESFKEPKVPLYFGNSGTTARLMIGLLSGLPFLTVIHGDPYLTERPMDRVVVPLRKMGSQIDGRQSGRFLPLAIRGGNLQGIDYELPVKSAQVKSALLLAGLFAEGRTTVTEQTKTRNHTENMLKAFGAHIEVQGNQVSITNKGALTATDVYVPGDISSAAFFMVAAAVVPNSQLNMKNIGFNKTRTGIIEVLKEMGAHLELSNEQVIGGEHMADITVFYAPLKGIQIEGDIIPRLIDEIPIIALLATQAEGQTVIKNAEELRVKETDRIAAVVDVLSTLGANIKETKDNRWANFFIS